MTKVVDGIRVNAFVRRPVTRRPLSNRPVQSAPRVQRVLRKKPVIEYPDLSDLLSPAIQPEPVELHVEATTPEPAARVIETAVVQPDQVHPQTRVRSRTRLKTVRRSVVTSGFSWFLVCAVISTSAIGLFSVIQHGRAAQSVVTDQATQAEQSLVAAATSLSANDLDAALASFDKASASFEQVSSEIANLSSSVRTIAGLLPGDPIGAADTLARAGVHVATAGRSLAAVVSVFSGVKLDGTDESRSLTEALTASQPDIHTVTSELTQAATLVAGVDPRGLPGDLPVTLTTLKEQIPGVLEQLHTLDGLVGVLAEVAGASQARTYAVVFQNPNELRPTGGFWGQLAFVKVQNGRVEKLDVKSIYDPAGQVQSHQTPPEGLGVISEEFELQDANWYADFPTSARVLLGFLSETGDPRLDGVIALNPRVVTDLLSLTGPVSVDQLGLTISEDNFTEEAQYEVADKDPERDRTFFPSLAEQLLGRVFSLDRQEWLGLASTLTHAVEHKDIQVFFGDSALTPLPQALGADGVLPSGVDLIAPTISNVGGGKTDQYVDESRAVRVSIGPEFVRHEVEITRRDTRTDQFKDRDNRSYLRMYVPEGAVLQEATGFDTDIKELVAHECSDCEAAIGTPPVRNESWDATSNTRRYTEGNHTVFANWVTLDVGEERTIKLVYDVPRASLVEGNVLKLYLWRQAGTQDSLVDLEVTGVAGTQVTYVSDATPAGGSFVKKLALDRDYVLGVLLE